MGVADWVLLAVFLGFSVPFTLMLVRGLCAVSRTTQRQESDQSADAERRAWRRHVVSRLLIAGGILVLVGLAAVVGAASGHGALTGVLVLSASLLFVGAFYLVVSSLYLGLRGMRRNT